MLNEESDGKSVEYTASDSDWSGDPKLRVKRVKMASQESSKDSSKESSKDSSKESSKDSSKG